MKQQRFISRVRFLVFLGIGILWGVSSVSAETVPPPDEIPADYLEMKNPIASLNEERMAYFRKQFDTKCARCHGENGKGVGEEADDMEVPLPNFTSAEFHQSRTDGHLFYQIEIGGEDKSAMPDFGPDSSAGWGEEKIWSMVRFIRSFAE